ncbi:methyltransferase [Streptacidiphilus sp. PAMC 29251]
MPDQKAVRHVIDIITGTWQSQALYAAVALGLADHVAAGHSTNRALAEQTRASLDGIVRLMRLLTAMDVFERTDAGYRLTATGELLRAGSPQSMSDLVRLYGEEFHQAWGAVVPAVRTGGSGFQHAFGRTLHEYLREPGAGAKFQRAMNAGNAFFPDVLEAFDFTDCRTVVDVAGGSGMLLGTVLAAYPRLQGVLFDQPHMVPVATAYLDVAVGPSRYRAEGGDVFQGVPAGADTYLLSRVLQDWDDSGCVTLLTHIREAMAAEGRLLILERVIPDGGSSCYRCSTTCTC